MESYNKNKGRAHTKKREGIPIVKGILQNDKVWTDFGKDRDKIQIVVILLVYNKREKAHDITSQGLEWSRAVWKDQKESRDRVISRNMLIAWVPYGIHMVHAWTMEIKSRVQSMTLEHMYIACWP